MSQLTSMGAFGGRNPVPHQPNEYPKGPVNTLIRCRAPRNARATPLRNLAGLITMMSQGNSSNIRSAVLPINNRL